MTFVLKILGWLLLGCVLLCFAFMAVAFCIGVLEAIRDMRRRQRRQVVKEEKRDEGGPTFRVFGPE